MILSSVLFPAITCAQFLSLGVKGGVPLLDAAQGDFGVRSEAKRYTVGSMVELKLPLSLAVEFDALYKRTGYSAQSEGFGITAISRLRANTWEFPLLVKYYLPLPLPVKPYAEVGYVARRVVNVNATLSSFGRDQITGTVVNQTIPLNTSFLVRDNPSQGVVAGGGVRVALGPIKISPEVRYTRWTGRLFEEFGSRGFFVQSAENQAEFLVGLSF